MRVSSFTVALICAAAPAAAQPFANAKTSLAGYSVASTTPKKTCESLGGFKGKEIATIQSRVVGGTADTPQHCRVTGIIAPEVAFEVDLPDQWNRRFYMTGNGGLAGDRVDQPNNPDRTSALNNGFVMARTNTGHDAQKEPSGSFILRRGFIRRRRWDPMRSSTRASSDTSGLAQSSDFALRLAGQWTAAVVSPASLARS